MACPMKSIRSTLRALALGLGVLACGGWCEPALAGFVSVSYTELSAGTQIDLTAEGTLDWIKFGNGENLTTSFLNTTKIGNPVFLPATLAPLGTPPAGTRWS